MLTKSKLVMRNARVCVACLVTDVRMYNMSASNLLQPYQLLAGVQMNDGMPQKLCWECAALVNKFNLFRHKCERAYLLLQDIYNQHDEISESAVRAVDRAEHNLISSYGRTQMHNFTQNVQEMSKKRPKKEPITPLRHFDIKLIKPEQTSALPDLAGKSARVRTHSALWRNSDCFLGSKASSNVQQNVYVPNENRQSEREKNTNVLLTSFTEESTAHLEIVDASDIKLEPEFEAIEDAEFEGVELCLDYADEAKGKNRKRLTHRDGIKDDARKKKRMRNVNLDNFNSTEIKLTENEARAVFMKRRNSESLKKAKYKCELCYRTFLNEVFYNKHLSKHDASFGRYQCDICKLRFKGKHLLRAHFGVQHTKKFICNICSKISYTRNIAKEHNRSHRKPALTAKKIKRKVKSAGKVGRKKTMDYDITTVNLSQEQMMEVIRERRFTENYKMSKFKCTLCYRGFREDKTYNNHMLLHDPSTGELQCDICKFRMKTRGRVHKHVTNYHLRKYICNICGNVNYSQDGARIHYMYHTGVTYPCDICGEKFRKMSSRLNHLRIKHPSDHVCGVCSESFVSPFGLKRHARLMHSMKQDEATGLSEGGGAHCAQCNIQFTTKQAQTRHILISPKHEHERSSIVNGCRDCGKTFKTWMELKSHRRAAHPAKKLRPGTQRHAAPRPPWQDKPCIQCGELMTSDRKYRGHFQVKHPGDPWPFTELNHPFMCEVCGKGFNCNANLIAHRNFHTGTRAYKCDICPKSFFLPFNLKQHYIAHSDERPHVCRVCRRGFKVKNGLERHMRSHTGEKPYDCTTCGKPFSSSTGRNAHMRAVHHKEPPLAAPFHRRRARPDHAPAPPD